MIESETLPSAELETEISPSAELETETSPSEEISDDLHLDTAFNNCRLLFDPKEM